MSRSRGVLSVTVLVLAIVSAGCGKKLLECRLLFKTINPSMQKLNELSSKKSDADSTDDIKQMASVLETTAADLGKLNLSTPELKKFSSDYVAMCKDTAGSFQQMLATVTSIQAGAKKLEGVGKATEASMKTFEQLCGRGRAPAECKPIAKRLKQMPDDLNNVAELDKFIDDFRTIKAKNAAVKAFMADFGKNLTDTSALVKEMRDGEKKVATMAAGLKNVTARESAIVDGVNAFCGVK